MNESIVSKFSGKTAIVTGASSGIGRAISLMLSSNGIKVIGLGRDFSSCGSVANVENVIVDLMDMDKTIELIDSIVKNNDVRILVNCAGVAYYGLHENISASNITEMIRVNVEAPLQITSRVLRDFKTKGGCHIIDVSSVTATKPAPHGACYGATKAALSSFGASIWEEARKHGVYVTDICPDMTATNLYRNADFGVDEDMEARIEPEDVAELLESVLASRDGVCVSSLKVMPRFNRIKRK